MERLAAQSGSVSESLFDAYGLGIAYRSSGRGSSKRSKINAALHAAEDEDRVEELLNAIAQRLGDPVTVPADTTPFPQAATGDQRRLLQAVWDLFYRNQRWPSLREVDQQLDRAYGLDLFVVAESLPGDMIQPPDLQGLQDSQELQLTVAGVRACDGSTEELDIFLEAIRLATRIEREFLPDTAHTEASLTPNDLRTAVMLPAAGLEHVLIRVGLMLKAEHWGWSSASRGDEGKADWRFALGRRVRKLREVTDLEQYWLITREGRNPHAEMESTMPRKLDTIFLVHGHDEARHEVARYLEKVVRDTEVVILSEQASRGRTVIEKFEAHGAAASFAVVLLTPDDEGRAVGAADLQPRARQNVVFELGYFVGKLGRDRVVVLNKSGVEKPSDIAGIVYIDFPRSNWKDDVSKELKAAGFVLS